jgi:hypothetical protein
MRTTTLFVPNVLTRALERNRSAGLSLGAFVAVVAQARGSESESYSLETRQ